MHRGGLQKQIWYPLPIHNVVMQEGENLILLFFLYPMTATMQIRNCDAIWITIIQKENELWLTSEKCFFFFYTFAPKIREFACGNAETKKNQPLNKITVFQLYVISWKIQPNETIQYIILSSKFQGECKFIWCCPYWHSPLFLNSTYHKLTSIWLRLSNSCSNSL